MSYYDDKRMTIRRWFAGFTEATGEVPTHVVFGYSYWSSKMVAEIWPEVVSNALVPMEELPDSLLDREFDDGFGGNNSPDLCAWSMSWVLFSDNYDGAESLCWVPRHPVAHEPIRPGGG